MVNNKVTLYKKIRDEILNEIKNYKEEGSMLPTEQELIEKYQVSRTTVRRAIDDLVAAGFVEKIQGRGTFVKSTKIILETKNLTSWTEEMKVRNKKPGTLGLKIYKVESSRKMQEKLNLKNDEEIICVERVRLADGEPIALMFNYLRAKYVPNFLTRGFTGESMYKALEEEYNILLDEAHEQVRARLATKLDAARLNISPGDPVLHITRTTFLKDGTPFEMVEMATRSDKYEMQVRMSGKGQKRY